ncbi:MAG: ATP-grasp domain-containing protein [Cyanosarcina radialis HA8281-LM2]|jgi:glutathione synthase/RimK-type ligase-like ATP-grasp enzyme|nr:ATP-grasp domain-containing protein [Cyanosarcina radialis HA8281-LM2]
MIPVILNRSDGKWAFEVLAQTLSRALWVDIAEEIGDFNYLLGIEDKTDRNKIDNFIPVLSIEIASDKRELEKVFNNFKVQRPKTFILDTIGDVETILKEYNQSSWILKYPNGCGGMHHRLIESSVQIPKGWECPFLLQEFIENDIPEVYRLYCVDSELFGFNVRRFDDNINQTPWVAHANGAKYIYGEQADSQAIEVAKEALIATNLYRSFGVVDLIKDRADKWYVLEVGTDGIYNYVDRDVQNDDLLHEINERLAKGFWKRIGVPPWGKTWKYRDI